MRKPHNPQSRITNVRSFLPRQRFAGEFRPLVAQEAGEFLAHLGRLSPEDRRRRFGNPIRDGAMANFVARIDWSSGLVIGYFEGGYLRGAIQLAAAGEGYEAATAELAIQIESDWQGRGIGSALLRKARAAARKRGVGRLIFFALAENQGVTALLSKFGARFRRVGSDVTGDLPLAVPA